MEERDINKDDYVSSETFKNNLETQERYYNEYIEKNRYKNPFHDFKGFTFCYNNMRASLLSLQNNPDTKDDPDFIELCNTWESLSFDTFPLCIDHLKELYDKLLEKPNFKNNPFTSCLYGSFMKSIYQLFYDSYYTQGFFKLK